MEASARERKGVTKPESTAHDTPIDSHLPSGSKGNGFPLANTNADLNSHRMKIAASVHVDQVNTRVGGRARHRNGRPTPPGVWRRRWTARLNPGSGALTPARKRARTSRTGPGSVIRLARASGRLAVRNIMIRIITVSN